MIHVYRLICFFLALSPFALQASNGSTEEWLDKLDASLGQRDYYEQLRTDRISQLRDGLPQARAEGREFEQLYQLFNEYKSYCYDSARY